MGHRCEFACVYVNVLGSLGDAGSWWVEGVELWRTLGQRRVQSHLLTGFELQILQRPPRSGGGVGVLAGKGNY